MKRIIIALALAMIILLSIGSTLSFAGEKPADSPDPPAQSISQANASEDVDQSTDMESADQVEQTVEGDQIVEEIDDNGWEERLNALGLGWLEKLVTGG